MHCGFLSREVFEVLGFRTVIPHETPVLANPVGLDGIFQAYCPPYYPSMSAAVDAVLIPMLRKSSAVSEPVQPLETNRTKLDEAAKILKARSSPRPVAR